MKQKPIYKKTHKIKHFYLVFLLRLPVSIKMQIFIQLIINFYSRLFLLFTLLLEIITLLLMSLFYSFYLSFLLRSFRYISFTIFRTYLFIVFKIHFIHNFCCDSIWLSDSMELFSRIVHSFILFLWKTWTSNAGVPVENC